MLNLSTDLSIDFCGFGSTTAQVDALSDRAKAAFAAVIGAGAVGAAIYKSALPAFLADLDLATAKAEAAAEVLA